MKKIIIQFYKNFIKPIISLIKVILWSLHPYHHQVSFHNYQDHHLFEYQDHHLHYYQYNPDLPHHKLILRPLQFRLIHTLIIVLILLVNFIRNHQIFPFLFHPRFLLFLIYNKLNILLEYITKVIYKIKLVMLIKIKPRPMHIKTTQLNNITYQLYNIGRNRVRTFNV